MLIAILSLAHAAPSGNYDLASDFVSEISGGFQDQLGHALAYGDLNDDGKPDLVVSLVGTPEVRVFFGPLASGHIPKANADFVFRPDPTLFDETGWSIAVGDLTNDDVDDRRRLMGVSRGLCCQLLDSAACE